VCCQGESLERILRRTLDLLSGDLNQADNTHSVLSNFIAHLPLHSDLEKKQRPAAKIDFKFIPPLFSPSKKQFNKKHIYNNYYI